MDPVLAQQKIRHRNDLADTAKKLYRNLKTIKISNGKLSGDILSGSIISGHQESLIVFDDKYKTPLERVNGLLAEGLLSHLQSESEQFANIVDWKLLTGVVVRSSVTSEMLRDLEKASHRRTFRANCTICRGWDTPAPKPKDPWKI